MIPTIDPRVKYVGASHLRKLNSNQLRQLEGVMVVRDNSEPLAVIVPYETYLELQQVAVSRELLSQGVDSAIEMIDAKISSGKGKASIETQRVRDARQAAGKMNRTRK